jgi:hypothetical protein
MKFPVLLRMSKTCVDVAEGDAVGTNTELAKRMSATGLYS